MTVRIHLRPEDLRNVQLSPVVSPLAAASAGMTAIFRGRAPHEAQSTISTPTASRDVEMVLDPVRAGLARDLLELPIPPGFVHLEDTDIDSALERVVCTPTSTVGSDLDRLVRLGVHPPRWTERLVNGDRHIRAELVSSMRYVHDSLVVHAESVLEPAAARAHRRQSRRLAENGLDAFRRGLHPRLRWEPPVLEYLPQVDTFFDLDLRLDQAVGVSIKPIPWLESPTIAVGSDGTPGFGLTVYYPLDLADLVRSSPDLRPGDERRAALATLIGGTRARVLRAVAARPGLGTYALAADLQVARASVSEHIAVLRDNALVVSHRHRRTVAHHITELGRHLLAGL